MISSGSRVGRSALMMLLVSLGAAVEVYDDAELEPDLPYQDDNDIAPGPFSLQPLPSADDVMLYRLVRALAHDQLSLQYRPNWLDTQGIEPVSPELKAIYKRFPSARQRQGRPQQKWKTKKGKSLGSQMVCYFKLCAFRSPH